MSEEDKKRRENFAKLKYDKLKNLDNYIDPCKLMVHNIPKVSVFGSNKGLERVNTYS